MGLARKVGECIHGKAQKEPQSWESRTPEDIRGVPDVKSHTSRQKGKPFVGWKLNPPLVDILAWRLKQHVGPKTLRK